jgi:hypothetical protein
MQWFASATLELGRILGVRFVPGSPANDTPVGRSTARVLELINAGRADEARYELVRISMLVKHLKEIEDARPELIPKFTARLLAHDVSAYIVQGKKSRPHRRSSAEAAGSSTSRPAGPTSASPSPVAAWASSAPPRTCPTHSRPRTSVHEDPEPHVKDVAYKLTSTIRAKERRAYAAPDVALVIDATNVWALTASPRPNMDPADAALAAGSYGAAIFHAFIFDLDNEIGQLNYVRRDSPKITATLAEFLNDHFPMDAVEIERHVIPLLQ